MTAAPAIALPHRPAARTHLQLIVNPRASGLHGGEHAAVTALLRSAFSVTVSRTEGGGHATELARDAAAAGVAVVGVLGGDGTVNEAAGGLAGSPAALACLPAGCTNVFARAIGTPRTPLAAAQRLVDSAERLPTRSVDVGTVNGRHFLCTSGVGFTASMCATADHAPDRKARLGQLHFLAAAAAEIAQRYLRDPPRMRVQAGGRVLEARTIVVQNARALTYFGAHEMRLCERAGLYTGTLSLTALRRTRPRDVASVIARLLSRRLAAHPQVEALAHLRGATVTAAGDRPLPFDADGEYLGEAHRIVYGVEPAALRVIA